MCSGVVRVGFISGAVRTQINGSQLITAGRSYRLKNIARGNGSFLKAIRIERTQRVGKDI